MVKHSQERERDQIVRGLAEVKAREDEAGKGGVPSLTKSRTLKQKFWFIIIMAISQVFMITIIINLGQLVWFRMSHQTEESHVICG